MEDPDPIAFVEVRFLLNIMVKSSFIIFKILKENPREKKKFLRIVLILFFS